MQWEGGAESSNVDDRRGMGGGTVAMAGGGAVGLIALVIYLFTGVNLGVGPGGPGPGGGGGGEQQAGAPANPEDAKFAKVILKFTEDVWTEQFANRANGYPTRRYALPKLVLFSGQVSTGCGNAPSAVGPFYCPADQTLYYDPSFFNELQDKLGGSKGEFSRAYVIAHEVGHHVQNLLGFSREVDKRRGTRDEKPYSVRLELQADYLAGVWAFHGQKKFKFIEPGDVESAVTSARAIGDDRLQKRSRGWVSPEGFTHGTSAQRVKYFTEGMKTGDATMDRLKRFFSAQYDARRGELVD